MIPRLGIEISSEPFEHLRAELAVACFFADVRPLRGAAGRADWRLCGQISNALRAERLCGRAGEAALFAGGPGLRAERLLLLGLGSSHQFRSDEVGDATREAIQRALDLGCWRLALASPAALLEAPGTARAAEEVLRGALTAVRGADRSVALTLWVPPETRARTRETLSRALARAPRQRPEVRIEDARGVSEVGGEPHPGGPPLAPTQDGS